MKRLLVLTAVAIFTLSAAGCDCCRWCRRGAFMPTASPDPCCEPCPTYGPACGPTCGPSYDPGMSAPMITPGPETYVPGPTN
jgi:hypothetical protein